MTHEFKTPLATISLAVDALRNEKVAVDKEKSNYFTSIIKEENKRMNKQVETILQAALLDKQEVNLNLKNFRHIHLLMQPSITLAFPYRKKAVNFRYASMRQKIILWPMKYILPTSSTACWIMP